MIPGDAKSLVVTDFNGDGWVDVLVGLNDGTLHAFFNLGRSAGQPHGGGRARQRAAC